MRPPMGEVGRGPAVPPGERGLMFGNLFDVARRGDTLTVSQPGRRVQ
ncbi:hypothetical protein [Pseudaestuariivita atlantica]|nr:hypothetical protein [Pseudaestuariivita atlantica]